MTIVYFVLIFGLVVIAHEFGHFLLAKTNGIRVNEFAIGMGPKLLHFKKGETEYCLRLLPIGGACVFEGEDDLGGSEDKVYDEGAFPAAGVWARISTVVAGPFFNFILGYLLAMIVVWFCGSSRPVVLNVMEEYPVAEAGMQSGDVITHLDGERVYLASEVPLYTYLNKDEPMDITYKRDGVSHTITVRPKYDEEAGRYMLGLNGYQEYVDCRNTNIFKYSYYEVRYCLKSTVKALGMLLSGNGSKDDVSGPIGVAQVIGDISEQAAPYGIGIVLINMLNIAMLLSVNLGVMNLLPLPALDGGRLVFLLIEALRGKPIPPEKEGMVHFAGFVALMILMVFVMYNDIMRLIGG